MPQMCTVCRHAQRAEIDELIIVAEPLRNIAERFGLSTTAVFRHQGHIANELLRAKGAAEIVSAETLLERVRSLLGDAQRVTAAAERTEQLSVALRGIAEIRGILELLGRLSGEIRNSLDLNLNLKSASAAEAREKLQALANRSGFALTVSEILTPEENENRIAELLAKANLLPRTQRDDSEARRLKQ